MEVQRLLRAAAEHSRGCGGHGKALRRPLVPPCPPPTAGTAPAEVVADSGMAGAQPQVAPALKSFRAGD